MNRTISYFLLSCCLAATIVFLACNKNAEEQTQLTIRLTDNPFNASEVNVDILKVRVNFRDDSAGWIDLNTRAGIYNLLALQNGVDTVLAQGAVPVNVMKELGYVLGSRNSI